MVIPQAGLPPDLLPTVTAFISATPNLGGVLGVGIIGTGMSLFLESSSMSPHDRLDAFWQSSTTLSAQP